MLNPIRHFRYGPETNSSYTNVLVIPPDARPVRFEGAVRLRCPGDLTYRTRDPGTVVWFFYCAAQQLGVAERFLALLKEEHRVLVDLGRAASCDAYFHRDVDLEGEPAELASYLADLCRFALDNRLEVVGIHDNVVNEEDEVFADLVLPLRGYLWRNGNYYVILFGTERSKVRIAFHNEELKPEYPELLDVKITDRCYYGCPWCAEDSRVDGSEADGATVRAFLERVPPGVEVTVGGGDPLLHPDLMDILETRPFVSVTVRDRDILGGRVTEALWHSRARLGVSLSPDTDVVELIWALTAQTASVWLVGVTATVHWIHGVNTVEQLKTLVSTGAVRRVLILGYKKLGRGAEYRPTFPRFDLEEIKDLARRNHVSLAFDQLAIEQLGLREYVLDRPLLYGGDEGQYSCFVDFVARTVHPSSSRVGGAVPLPETPYEGWARDVFQITRARAREESRVRSLTLLPAVSGKEESGAEDRARFRRAVEDALRGRRVLVELWVRNEPHRLRALVLRPDHPGEVELRWAGNPSVSGATAEVTVNGELLRVPVSDVRKLRLGGK